MKRNLWQEQAAECRVTYTLEVQGELFIIENVPARVNLETGELNRRDMEIAATIPAPVAQ